jgi:hypothetical protein
MFRFDFHAFLPLLIVRGLFVSFCLGAVASFADLALSRPKEDDVS